MREAPVPSVVVTGTLRGSELETGPLVLDADDGTTWELILPPGWSVDSQPRARVTIAGDAPNDVATAAMLGPTVRVRSLSPRG